MKQGSVGLCDPGTNSPNRPHDLFEPFACSAKIIKDANVIIFFRIPVQDLPSCDLPCCNLPSSGQPVIPT